MTELSVIASETFFRPPSVVATFNDNVHFFEPVLSHVPTEDATPALVRGRVPSVHGTAPHVSDPVGIDGRVRSLLRNERVVWRDPVPLAV